MNRIFLVLILAISSFGYTYVVAGEELMMEGMSGNTGLFCKIEKVDVCVMAQTEEDCTKLGGVKAEKCEAAENEGK